LRHLNLTSLIFISNQPDGTSLANKQIGEGEKYLEGAPPLLNALFGGGRDTLWDKPLMPRGRQGGKRYVRGVRVEAKPSTKCKQNRQFILLTDGE